MGSYEEEAVVEGWAGAEVFMYLLISTTSFRRRKGSVWAVELAIGTLLFWSLGFKLALSASLEFDSCRYPSISAPKS